MKLTLLSVFVSLLAAFAMAAAPQQSVIVSYPEGTPDSVLEQAKNAIIEAVRPPIYATFLLSGATVS